MTTKREASEAGSTLALLRAASLSPARRREIARNAIRIRWERERARKAEAEAE